MSFKLSLQKHPWTVGLGLMGLGIAGHALAAEAAIPPAPPAPSPVQDVSGSYAAPSHFTPDQARQAVELTQEGCQLLPTSRPDICLAANLSALQSAAAQRPDDVAAQAHQANPGLYDAVVEQLALPPASSWDDSTYRQVVDNTQQDLQALKNAVHVKDDALALDALHNVRAQEAAQQHTPLPAWLSWAGLGLLETMPVAGFAVLGACVDLARRRPTAEADGTSPRPR